jgi:hypothetical protein
MKFNIGQFVRVKKEEENNVLCIIKEIKYFQIVKVREVSGWMWASKHDKKLTDCSILRVKSEDGRYVEVRSNIVEIDTIKELKRLKNGVQNRRQSFIKKVGEERNYKKNRNN